MALWHWTRRTVRTGTSGLVLRQAGTGGVQVGGGGSRTGTWVWRRPSAPSAEGSRGRAGYSTTVPGPAAIFPNPPQVRRRSAWADLGFRRTASRGPPLVGARAERSNRSGRVCIPHSLMGPQVVGDSCDGQLLDIASGIP